MKKCLVIILVVCSAIKLTAQQHFDFNPRCQEAYRELMQLKLVPAQSLLEAEKKENPGNLIPVVLEDYIDFFTLFFNEDPAAYKMRSKNRDQRLALISKGSSKSPWYRFSLGVIQFHWAVVRIKFGHNWDAGWEFRRSFLEFRNNTTRFPDFLPNRMYQHAMQVAAGSVPEGYKWLSSLLGIRGNITNGMSGLRNFLADQSPDANLFRNEAIFFYCYLSYYIENNKEGVLAFIRDQKLDTKNNHLFAYLATNLSIHNQQAAAALHILEGRNLSPEYLQTPVWDLEKGYALLAKQDPAAATSLDRFVKDFKGKYYVKDALQKLSWHYYLAGDHERAEQYRKQLLAAPDSGSEADTQAQREAESGTWPNKILLRARLLNDGGYQRDALRLLHGKSDKDFVGIKDRLEFLYRAGRVYDDLGSAREAIHFYKQAVNLGKSREEYFASRAALQIGLIYEKQAQFKLAADWFRTAIAMKNHEYKNSIDQRAKAGVFRSENALKASNKLP